MRRFLLVVSFVLVLGGGAAMVGAQGESPQEAAEVGGQPAGCGTPTASPGATPESTPFTTGEGMPGSTPVASPVDLTGCATPEIGTPGS